MTLAIVDATRRGSADALDAISASRYTMPFGNVPLISHVVGTLVATGVERARVITAPGERQALQAALATCDIGGLALEIVEAPDVLPRRAMLAELDVALGAGEVLLAPGDGLCAELLAEMRARFGVGDVDLVLAAGEAVAVRGATAPGRLTETAMVLGPRTRTLVAGLLARDCDGTDFTEALLRDDLRLAVCDGSDSWSYDGSTAALLAGNRRVLDGLAFAPYAEEIAEANELHGRISVGRGVFASGCVIHGPVAIGDHAVLEDSHIGPFTSIGPSAIVAGAELDDSILLAGAEVRNPGHRITGSILGERARVDRSLSLPRGLRLRLGADSRVTFG